MVQGTPPVHGIHCCHKPFPVCDLAARHAHWDQKLCSMVSRTSSTLCLHAEQTAPISRASHVDTPHTNAQHRAANPEAHGLWGLAALFRVHGVGTDQVDGRAVLDQGRVGHVLR